MSDKEISAKAPRESCAYCVRKHLGQASALLQESLHGYPDHVWLAIGHMAEAEAESEDEWPEFSEKIREERKRIESDGDMPDLVSLIREMTELAGDGKSKESSIAERVAKSVVWKEWSQY